MRARFVVVNVMMLAVLIAAWRIGMFGAVPALGEIEIVMLAALACYGSVGFAAAFAGRWESARHLANGIPMWGMAFTGLGMLLAVTHLRSLTPDGLSAVFRDFVFAISPNVLAVALMAWLREVLWWCHGAET